MKRTLPFLSAGFFLLMIRSAAGIPVPMSADGRPITASSCPLSEYLGPKASQTKKGSGSSHTFSAVVDNGAPFMKRSVPMSVLTSVGVEIAASYSGVTSALARPGKAIHNAIRLVIDSRVSWVVAFL